MDNPSEAELDQQIRDDLDKTPAYSLHLVIYKEELDLDQWNARFRDNLGSWSSDDYTENGYNSAPAAICEVLSQLLEALREGDLTQGVLTYSGVPKPRERSSLETWHSTTD